MPKTNKQIQRDFKARKNKAGLKRHEIRCYDMDWPAIQAFANAKTDKRELINSVDDKGEAK